MIYDHYKPLFPQQPPQQPYQPGVTSPMPSMTEMMELRKLIDEFREAVKLAKQLDVVTRQPDCEDAEKKRLEERVAELEKQLDLVRELVGNGVG